MKAITNGTMRFRASGNFRQVVTQCVLGNEPTISEYIRESVCNRPQTDQQNERPASIRAGGVS